MRSIRTGFGARSRTALEQEGLSPEAAAAIGAGDKTIPAPKKDGEVPANISNGEDPVAGNMDGTKGKDEPKEKKDIGSSAVKKDGEVDAQLSNGEDPTVSVATGGEGKVKELVGTAGALESRGAKAPKRVKFSPIQRARIKVALEDDGLTSEEAEQEIRRQEEGIPEAPAAEVPPAEVPPAGDERAAAAEVPEVPAVGEAAPDATGGELPPVEPTGDLGEAAAGAEAAAGEVPGQDPAGADAAIPAAGTEAGAELGADLGGEAGAADVGAIPPAGEVGEGDAGGVEDIDPVELENARRLVARADEVAARTEGREVPPDAGAETGGLDLGADTGLPPAEGGEGLPTQVEAEAEQVEDNATGLETELMDIAESEGEVDQVNERVEAGFEVVETMEAYREALSTALESGGLNRHGARMYQIGLEALYQRLDLEMPRPISLESFGGASKQMSASQLSLESLGAQIKAIWEKIYKAIVAGLQMAGQLAEKIFNGAVALEARAKQVAAKVQSAQGQPSAREIDDQQLAAALFVPGGNPLNGMLSVSKVAKGLAAAYPKMLQAADAAVSQLTNTTGLTQTDSESTTAYPWTPQLLQGWASNQNGNRLMSDVLPGGMILEFFISDQVQHSSAQMDQEVEAPSNVKLPVLSAPQAGTVAKQVLELAGIAKQSKAEVAKAQAVGKKLAQVAQSFASRADMEDGDARQKAEFTRGAVLAIKKALEEPFKSFNVYAIRTGNAALSWAEKSAALYGAGAAAAKPAAPAAEAPAKA